ncbi:MAG: 4-hydroxy-3-methylbut-2-enyl diphosphate reductase [Rikenellaceae bacterium]|jgi:4-hydroxy-3-methylbut-2-enyl diphosphate reductase|nr:4-hydroxy-3-methylbut-2-enyl diphosphate reductase [Rikenellaceae bacterium]
MQVEIDKQSGFCFGVVTAIHKAEESLSGGKPVFSLGDIVHNRVEVSRLESEGLKTVSHADFPRLRGETVLIRAHGEPPSTYRQAEEHGIVLVDATCPVVSKLQERVKKAFEQMRAVQGQVVILGKKGHAEVVGLAGQAEGQAIIIENPADLEQIDFARPVYLLSQTTQSLALFEAVKAEILRRAADPVQVVVNDTICRQVSNRDPHLRNFSRQYDVIIFVSGKKSSNGKALFAACIESNARSYPVEDEQELDPEWFTGADSVGVCGATSTPKWLMERVAEHIRQMMGRT